MARLPQQQPAQQGLWAAAHSLLAARSRPAPPTAVPTTADITTTSSKNNDSSSHSSTSGTRPTASAAPPTQQMTDFVEVALTPEELPPGPLREALKRTLAISAGTLPLRDMRRLLQEHYARCVRACGRAWVGAAGPRVGPVGVAGPRVGPVGGAGERWRCER